MKPQDARSFIDAQIDLYRDRVKSKECHVSVIEALILDNCRVVSDSFDDEIDLAAYALEKWDDYYFVKI
jgi:hypothetical protein